MNKHINIKDDKILQFFLQRVRSQLVEHLKQIILFGSRARGDHTLYSDYDCMVLVDTLSPGLNDAIDELAGEFLCKYSAVFSIFAVPEERYRKQIYNPFFMNVRREGISL